MKLLGWLEIQLFLLLFNFTVYTFKVGWYFFTRLAYAIMLLFLYIGRGIDNVIGLFKNNYNEHKVETILGFPYMLFKAAGARWLNPFLSELIFGYNIYDKSEDEEEITEELPFCQIINLAADTDLHIIEVKYCPDETAFIRVVSDDSYTKPYKRKVQRDKRGERFILFNNERFYLDPKKTQPRMPE